MRNSLSRMSRRNAKQNIKKNSVINRIAVEAIESRLMMSVSTMADWTFETSQPAGAGPFAPETGTQIGASAASGSHAGAAVYSTPAGDGSAHSFSSNTWAVGDYYQFKTDTAGESAIQLVFDQTSSNTGPKNFQLEYSTDGTHFTNFGSAYSVLANAAPNAPWSNSGTVNTAYQLSFDLTSATAINNQSTVYFRLADSSTTSANGGTVASGGTDRMDNVVISGTDTPAPTIGSLSVNPTSVIVNSGSTISLTANNVTDPVGGTITGVNFYQGNSPTGTLLGAGTSDGAGNWTLSGVSTAGLPTGSANYYAIATDNAAFTSAAISTTLSVIGTQQVSFDSTTYSTNESNGTVTVTVDRTGSTANSATVTYTTSDGIPFTTQGSQIAGNAVAGTDYTATTGTLAFTGTATSETFTVNLSNIKTFAGTRAFNITLSNPVGTNLTLGTSTSLTTNLTTAVTITDNTVTAADGIATPQGATTSSYAVGTTAGTGAANSFIAMAFNGHNSFANASMPEVEFGSASSGLYGNGYSATAIDSVKLSLYNTATTGGFAGVPGTFSVYLLTNDGVPATSLTYAAGGDTGPAVLGNPPEAGAILVGNATFTNNTVGYNDFTFDNLSPAVESALVNYYNGGGATPTRFVIIPDSPMSVDWQGNNASFPAELPQLTLLVEKSTNIVEDYHLGASTDTINKGASDTITVTRTGPDISDAASVPYTLSGTDTIGTDYTLTGPNGTTTSTGTFNFAAGSATASVTVNALLTRVSADTSFGLTLGTPAPAGTGHVGILGSPSAEVVTIHDPNTVSVSTTNSFNELATVLSTGPRAGANGLAQWQVEGASNGTFSSYAVADFNDSNTDGVHVFFPGSDIPASNQLVGTINSITLGTISTGASFAATGLVNVYLTTDPNGAIAGGGTGLTYNSADGLEGVGNQLGTLYSLGSFTINPGQSTSGYTNVQLTAGLSNTAAMQILANALNNGTKFGIVLTPGDNPATSEAMSFQGDTTTATDPQAPEIAFNYTPLAELSAQNSSILNVNLNALGAVTITNSGGNITVSQSQNGVQNSVQTSFSASGITGITVTDTQSNDVLNFDGPLALPVTFINCGSSTVNVNSGTLTFAPNMGGTINLGTLSVANGASAVITATTTSSRTTLSLNALSIGTTSGVLDVSNNEILVNYGSGTTPKSTILQYLASGSNGSQWNGTTGIVSSAAATHSSYGVGMVDGADNVSGASVSSGQIEVAYTLNGDANLDGRVDATDFGIFAPNFGATGFTLGWAGGDFNYNGTVDATDFGLFAPNFGQSDVLPGVAKPAATAPLVTTPNAVVTTPAVVSTTTPLLKHDKTTKSSVLSGKHKTGSSSKVSVASNHGSTKKLKQKH